MGLRYFYIFVLRVKGADTQYLSLTPFPYTLKKLRSPIYRWGSKKIIKGSNIQITHISVVTAPPERERRLWGGRGGICPHSQR